MSLADAYRRARPLLTIALAIASLSALIWLVLDDRDGAAGVSYAETVAVVALVAATGWALLAARSTIRRQKQAQIELLPTQPGDVGSAGRSDRPPAGARALSEEYLIAYAPGELAWLRTRVDAALASREAYDDRIAPLLRELAVARGARAGRRIDPDALVDIGPHLPGEDGVARRLLMRVPAYRRKVLARAVGAVITAIEEID